MSNEIRALTDNEVQLVAGGYYGQFDIPDPQPPKPTPVPDYDEPLPDPSWFFIDPSVLIPIPEPAKPGIGKP